MPTATQQYPPVKDDWAIAAKLQTDLATLFDIINRLEVDNFNTPGGEFDWNNTKLKQVVAGTDETDAVNLDQLETTVSAAIGTHRHQGIDVDGSLKIDHSVLSGVLGSGDRHISATLSGAMTNANAPSETNPFATMDDLAGVTPAASVVVSDAESWSAPTTTEHWTMNQYNLPANSKIVDFKAMELRASTHTGGGEELQAAAFILSAGGLGFIHVLASGTFSKLYVNGNYTPIILPLDTWVKLDSEGGEENNCWVGIQVGLAGSQYMLAVKAYTLSEAEKTHNQTLNLQFIVGS